MGFRSDSILKCASQKRSVCTLLSADARGLFPATLIASALLVLVTPYSLSADEFDPGFVQAKSPNSMFSRSIHDVSDKKFRYFPFMEEKQAPKFQASEEKTTEKKEEEEIPEAFPSDKQFMKLGTSVDEIREKYGNPEDEPVLPVQDSAPMWFKAFMEAKQNGHDEEAFNWLRQGARYQDKFQNTMENYLGMYAKALEAEGKADGEGWTAAPQFDKFNKYVALAEKAKETARLELEKKTIDPFLRALPKQHKERARIPFAFADSYDLQRELQHRDEFRRAFMAVAPVASDKRVDLTVYVQAKRHKDSLLLLRELKGLAKIARRNGYISLKIVTKDYLDKSEIASLQRKTGMTGVPTKSAIDDGELPELLPAVQISIPSLKKTWSILGMRRGYFFEELVSVMHGEDLT